MNKLKSLNTETNKINEIVDNKINEIVDNKINEIVDLVLQKRLDNALLYGFTLPPKE